MRRYITHKSELPGDAARRRGEKVCRWCAKPLPARRSSWCSDACSHEYMIRSSGSWLRTAVHKRDKGVCASCGFDADEVIRRACALYYGDDGMRRRYDNPDTYAVELIRSDLKARGFKFGYAVAPDRWPSLWHADHINPVVLGGGGCGLENVRTLCVPCHKRETAKLAKRRAEENKAAKQAGNGTLFERAEGAGRAERGGPA